MTENWPLARNPIFGNCPPKFIDTFYFSSRMLPNMFRDRASILMEAKAKRKPASATSVVGFGLVSVAQEIK
jgi:hypothetical protein